jgi:hypothetical protein
MCSPPLFDLAIFRSTVSAKQGQYPQKSSASISADALLTALLTALLPVLLMGGGTNRVEPP